MGIKHKKNNVFLNGKIIRKQATLALVDDIKINTRFGFF